MDYAAIRRKHNITQAEWVDLFLEGSVNVIEGRGYEGEGIIGFNVSRIISYDPEMRTCNMHSYSQCHVKNFVLILVTDGFQWEIPVGIMTSRFTAFIKDDTRKEAGDRILRNQEPIRIFELSLQDWEIQIGLLQWQLDGNICWSSSIEECFAL